MELKIFEIVNYIVGECNKILAAHTDQGGAPVNYVAIFAHSDIEYRNLLKQIEKFGKVAIETPTGSIFKLDDAIQTQAGDLSILKIRKPDATRPQRGDIDYTLADYQSFKEKYLGQENFSLIVRPNFEMLELNIPGSDVLLYFSSIPIIKQLETKKI